MKFLTIVLTCLTCAFAQAKGIAIQNATIYTMAGQEIINNGTILIDNGVIKQVGKNIKIPADYRRIDAKNKIVTPGFMNALTLLGLYENTLSGSHEDHVAPDADFSAALDISYAINPKSTLIPITRIEGITRAAVSPLPSKTIFGGLGSLIHLGDSDNITTHTRAFMTATMGESGADKAGGSRGAAWTYLYNALRESAGDFSGGQGKTLLTTLDINSLKPVVNGKIPLVVYASRASDIRNVIQLKKNTNVNVILLGGEEGWMVAKELAQANIPVILDGSHNLPTSFESLASTKANPARLHKAGVKIAFTTMLSSSEDHNARLVPQFAGQAVAYGLPKYAALKALSINPATMFGIDNYGTLSSGMAADIVIWSGDPLEVMSSPDYILIQGREVSLESRQTKLRDRYLQLKDTKPFGYKR